jgi:ankyrin repeat protein
MRVAPTGESIVRYGGGGQLDTVNLLLAAGADIDTIAKRGPKVEATTALLLALQKDESEMVRFLIERGADVNRIDENGLTPLVAAADKGNSDIFTILLAEGADPRIPDRKGRTPLMAAVENGNVNIINALLAEGFDPNCADSEGNTLLHIAINENNTEAFKVLLENGADPRAANMYGWTPLHRAAATDAAEEVFEALLAEGADPNARDRHGRTVLDSAARSRVSEEVRELLIAHGARRPIRKPLFELWVTIFLLALLPLPYYRFYSFQYRYYRREEEDGSFYFEVQRRDDILQRTIQVLPGRPSIRETVSGKATLKETADLIPCGAKEFNRHWRYRNLAQLLLNLHLRICVLALLFSAIILVFPAEEEAIGYLRFSPFFAFMKFLEYFLHDPDDWLTGVMVGGPLVAGALELIILLILQFVKPPFRRRVIAIVVGVIAAVISIGWGLYIIAWGLSSV